MLDCRRRTRFVSQVMVMADGQSFAASTTDISLTGLFLSTNQHLPVGRIASISLSIPSASKSSIMNLDGFVVRNNFHGIGIKFRPLDHETFSHLRTVINNRKPLPYHYELKNKKAAQ